MSRGRYDGLVLTKCPLSTALLIQLLVLASLQVSSAQNRETNSEQAGVDIAPPPGWVKPVTAPPTVTAGVEDTGTAYLLVDRQENLEQRAFYYHEVRKVTSENGLQSAASISISFDPAHDQLILHSIQLRRNETLLNRLDRTQIKLTPREKNAERAAYNPSRSTDIVLEDVRVGDLIEYAYTVASTNSSERRKYSNIYDMQWDIPVAYSVLYLVYPATRQLRFESRNGAGAPTITKNTNTTEMWYEARNIPGRVIEDNVPYDYSPRPQLIVSEFQDWTEVVRWAMPLFATGSPNSPEFDAEVEKLKAIVDPERRVVAALQFVQDEVRDISIGSIIGHHRVASPDEVMRRRSGDDKDKALLLVALLRAGEIEAAPALVSDSYRSDIQKRLPLPDLFNHVIVQVQLSGVTSWVDPWRESQRGPLSQIYVARFGYALVLRPESAELTAFTAPKESWPVKNIVENYRIPAPDAPADLEVVSEYHGLAADQTRASFRKHAREEIQKRYLEYYARTFPEAKPEKLLWYEELPGEDGCRVTEMYSIPHLWQLSDNKDHYFITLQPGDISSALGSTASRRADPLNVDYPNKVTQKLKLEMFEDWPIEGEGSTTTNEFFKLSDQPSSDGSHVEFNYSYEALKDRIETAELPAYDQAISKAKDSLSYTLSYKTPEQLKKAKKPSTFNWAVGAALLCFLGPAISVAYRYFQRSRLAIPPTPTIDAVARLNGIGGWLILVAITLLLRPLGYLKIGFTLLPTILSTGTWRSLTDPIESTYNPWWAPSLLFELFFNILAFVFCLLLIALFFGKRAVWPRAFVLYLIINLVGVILDTCLMDQIPSAAEPITKSMVEIGGMALAAAIWIPYALVSKRVKATFRY